MEDSERDEYTRPPDLLLEKLYAGQEATVRTGHGATDWFQIEKEYDKAVYCHPAYLTYMWSGGGLVAKSCLTAATLLTIACQAPRSMGILQASILEWVAIPSSRGSSQPRDRTQVSHITGGLFTI